VNRGWGTGSREGGKLGIRNNKEQRASSKEQRKNKKIYFNFALCSLLFAP